REALRNCTETKVQFRVKSLPEAEDLAGDVVDLDLEAPVQTLIRPTVIDHEIVTLKGSSIGDHAARSSARGHTTTTAHTDALGLVDGVSSASMSGSADVQNASLTSDPTSGFF